MSDSLEELRESCNSRDDKVKPHEYHGLESQSGELDFNTKAITHLEPLIEFVYDESESGQYNDKEYTQVYIQQFDVPNSIQDVSGVPTNEDNSTLIQPLMPFYLTTSDITEMDDNEDKNEIETIILQVDKEDEDSEVKRDLMSEEERDWRLQFLLCSPKKDSALDKFTCDVCSQSYGCFNCLKSHYETMHLGYNYVSQYRCKNSKFTTKGLCCPVCELFFENRNDMIDHYITHAVACDICGSGFDRQKHLTEHRRKVHNKGDFDVLYDCEICRVSHQYPSGLTKHYQKVHKLILCIECKSNFTSVEDLQEHENTHRQKIDVLPYACSKCDRAFAQISEIAVHIRMDHTRKRKVEKKIEKCVKSVFVIGPVNESINLGKRKVIRVKRH
ncbi:PR domain zinc finger protein 5-like [Diorhabda sublineata]|uniref:PR domain zinc finger protein 5-like n=1 Tax=Diorhabda sublineata TaxID=1163346 RepID=UPI0024E0E57B|nr:PR domain zinc finger protein 5-like [Diorhabda sublineata]